jgi:hypothetical protein
MQASQGPGKLAGRWKMDKRHTYFTEFAVWSKNSNAGYLDEKRVLACGVSE